MENKTKNVDIRKTQNSKGVKHKGRREIDTLPKVEVVVESDFPEVVGNTTYEANKSVTYETADSRAFTRHLEYRAVTLSLRNEFRQEHKDFIFSKFEGNILEYIAEKNEIDIDEVLNRAKVEAAVQSIPGYLKVRGARQPKADSWA